MRVRHVVAVAVTVVAVAGLSGCAFPAQQAGKVTPPPSGSASPSAAADATGEIAKAKAASVAQVGGTVTYPSGVAVTVVSVSRTKFGEYSSGFTAGHVGVKVVVKIRNGTTAPKSVSLADVHLSAGVDGVQVERVLDSSSGVGMGFDGTIAPGRAATAAYGFSVPPAAMGLMSIDVRSGLDDSAPALFEGNLK